MNDLFHRYYGQKKYAWNSAPDLLALFNQNKIISLFLRKKSMTQQVTFNLPRFQRGVHLITGFIEEKIPALPPEGLINIFLHHTSAALAVNEDADPDVRHDFESWFDRAFPEDDPLYTHTCEGSDDIS